MITRATNGMPGRSHGAETSSSPRLNLNPKRALSLLSNCKIAANLSQPQLHVQGRVRHLTSVPMATSCLITPLSLASLSDPLLLIILRIITETRLGSPKNIFFLRSSSLILNTLSRSFISMLLLLQCVIFPGSLVLKLASNYLIP